MTCTADRRENAPQQHGRRATATQERLDRALLVLHQQQTAVAVAAHDMKNNLTVIRTAAQLVERQMRRAAGPEPEHVLSLVTTIQSGATKLQQLVDDFLDLARLQSGEPLELNREPTDLVALARACVRAYAQTADRDLTFATATDTLLGEVDAARLERVLANLLSNAIKYSAPGSALRVSLAPDDIGAAAVLVVADHGVGIPAADLPRVFTPFFRGSNVARTTAGTGIGLVGARAFVEQQGGTLTLVSTEGQGTTVTVRLPLLAMPVSHRPASESTR
jgi:signal transduction histidine kinase